MPPFSRSFACDCKSAKQHVLKYSPLHEVMNASTSGYFASFAMTTAAFLRTTDSSGACLNTSTTQSGRDARNAAA